MVPINVHILPWFTRKSLPKHWTKQRDCYYYRTWQGSKILDYFLLISADECPNGYLNNPGTISGSGKLEYHKNMGSMDDCFQLCQAEEYCCSFEYSDSKKTCYLNVDCHPTKGSYKDYIFCMKEASTTIAATTSKETTFWYLYKTFQKMPIMKNFWPNL